MSQDSENWELLQALFHVAETTPVPDRERVLEEHCADPELRRRVLAILHGADLGDDTETIQDSIPYAGKIGPYSLVRLIGAGGIGSVYLAERILGGSPQRVALKILAPHAAGPSFVERFHREQHILASLNHKNITRLLDAGITSSGQPYLVMEYIQGIHLDEFCDAEKLDIRRRIELFLQICDAVAYAHRNLIVHLDLKPSNVLVNDEGTVKLLDFGTSKLIQPDSLLTTTVLATPAYASPEQLRNEPVTTACDIYSLGAILFDLLAGRRPTARASASAMFERAMTEAEPDRLPDAISANAAEARGVSEARLRQLLTGDLATITSKCLRPRPKDRYPSVDALADDLRRYLDGRSVLARPQTATYRISKFVRRNRRGVAVTTLVALAVLSSIVYAAWRQQQAIEEGRRAERMQAFMYALFSMAHSSYFGKPTMNVNEFLNLGVKTLPLYIHDHADLLAARNSLARSLLANHDLDDAQNIFNQSIQDAKAIGDTEVQAQALTYAGEIAFRKANADQGKRLTAQALDLARNPRVSPSVRVLAEWEYAYYRDDEGPTSDGNLKLLYRAVEEAKTRNLPPVETADAIYALADDLEERGRLDDAEPLVHQAIQLYSQDPAYACNVAQMEEDLGFILRERGNFSDALTQNQQAYQDSVKCMGADNDQTLYNETYVAEDLTLLGRSSEAVPMLEHIVALKRRPNSQLLNLADPLYLLARAYEAAGRPEDAEHAAKEAIDLLTAHSGTSSRIFGVANLAYARAFVDEHRDQEALSPAEMADRILWQPHSSRTYFRKKNDAEAHQLLLDVRARLSADSSKNLQPAAALKK